MRKEESNEINEMLGSVCRAVERFPNGMESLVERRC